MRLMYPRSTIDWAKSAEIDARAAAFLADDGGSSSSNNSSNKEEEKEKKEKEKQGGGVRTLKDAATQTDGAGIEEGKKEE